MKLKILAIVLFTITGFAATAQRKPADGGAMLRIISADSRRTLPGRHEMQPVTNYRIIAVWQGSRAPQNFFWRADGVWMHCQVTFAHTRGTEPGGYLTEPATLSHIRRGDTLELVPMPGAAALPRTMPAVRNNTLLFTAPAGKWWYKTIAKISRQPDVIIP